MVVRLALKFLMTSFAKKQNDFINLIKHKIPLTSSTDSLPTSFSNQEICISNIL